MPTACSFGSIKWCSLRVTIRGWRTAIAQQCLCRGIDSVSPLMTVSSLTERLPTD